MQAFNMSGNKTNKKFYLQLSCLSFVFLMLSSIRLYRVFDVGIDDYNVDSFFYWQTAFEWMQGHIPTNEHYRPFIYWLYSYLLQFTNSSDWVLKVFNIFCDIFVGVFIVLTGWSLRKNLMVAFAAAFTYFSLFPLLLNARSEVVHAPSSIFLVVSIYLLFKWIHSLSLKALFLSGSFLSMAWNIHPDLAVLGSAVALVILFKLANSSKTNAGSFWMVFAKHFSVFLVGYWIIFFAFAWKIGLSESLQNLLVNHKTQAKVSGTLGSRLYTHSFNYIIENLGTLLTTLFIGSYFGVLWKSLKKRLTSQDVLLAVFPITYLFFCALWFSAHYISRLFLPLVPMSILFIYIQISDFLPKKGSLIVLLLTIITAIFNTETYTYPFRQEVSIYKRIDERFKNTITEGNYLIAPLSTMSIHSPLSKDVYLNGRGVYLMTTEESSLDKVILQNNIRYVWIANILYDSKIFGENYKFTHGARLKVLFDLDHKDYDRDKEIKLLKDYLKSKNATLVHNSDFGEIYEL